MAKNALTLFGNNGGVAIPDHIQKFMDDEGGNITGRETVPSLTYAGKVWAISMNGEKTKLEKRDDDGEMVPRQTMKVVILDYSKRRGRAYYEGSYDPDKPGAPICWSDDGVKPHANVQEPQCATCANCQWAVKGSKVSDNGKATKACAEHRMVAVVPAGDLEHTPLRLKLAITSDWDAQSPDLEAKGWRAFQNYTDSLKAGGLQHTAAIVTKMKFDPGVDYPKVVFSADRWLSEEEVDKIAPVVKSDEVKNLLNSTWTPAGVDGVKNEPAKALPATAKPKVAPPGEDELDIPPALKRNKTKPAPAPAAEDDEDDAPPPKTKAKKPATDDDDDEAPPPKAKPKAKAPVENDEDEDAPAPKAKPKASVKKSQDDDDEDDAPAPKAKPKAKAAPADDDDDEAPAPKSKVKPKAGSVPEDVEALLEEWGDD